MAKTNRLFRPEQHERQPRDFYPTPPRATECLLKTVPLRGFVWEPCAGQGAMAKVIADAGYAVLASDLVPYDDCVFPILTGVDALEAPLPTGVQTIVTNPPYGKSLLPRLVAHWLDLLRPVNGQLCLLLNARWSEGKQDGQDLTTRHPAYAGKVKMFERIKWFEGTDKDNGGSPQHNHAWLIWDWHRDATKLPFDLSPGDPRLKTGCAVCGASLEHMRPGAKTCSARCRAALSRRRASAL